MDTDRKKAKERVKELSLKEKIKYYWGYYKAYFITGLLLVLLIGCTVYDKVTEVKPNLSVMVFSDSLIKEETESILKEKIEQLAFTKDSEKEHFAEVFQVQIPFSDNERVEEVQVACTKLMAELSLGERKVFILDKAAYEYTIKNVDSSEIWDERYSFKIGENGKKALGLDANKEYYYLTQIIYGDEKDSEENQQKFEYMKKVSEELKALN